MKTLFAFITTTTIIAIQSSFVVHAIDRPNSSAKAPSTGTAPPAHSFQSFAHNVGDAVKDFGEDVEGR